MNAKIFSVLALVTGFLMADGEIPNPSPHHFTVAPKVVHLKNDNTFYGVHLGYECHTADAIYAHVSLSSLKGQFREYLAHFDFHMGYTIGYMPGVTVTPFLGLGSEVRHKETNGFLYKEDFTQDMAYVVATGLKVDYTVLPNVQVGAKIMAKPLCQARTSSKIYNDTTVVHEKENFWAFDLSLPVTLGLGETNAWHVKIEPSYHRNLMESDTHAFGCHTALGYRF